MKTKKLIKKVIKNFDFDTVQRTMAFLNWEWVFRDEEGERRIPNVDELKEAAKKLLEKSIDASEVSAGGFKATYRDEILSLEFVLVDSIRSKDNRIIY